MVPRLMVGVPLVEGVVTPLMVGVVTPLMVGLPLVEGVVTPLMVGVPLVKGAVTPLMVGVPLVKGAVTPLKVGVIPLLLAEDVFVLHIFPGLLKSPGDINFVPFLGVPSPELDTADVRPGTTGAGLAEAFGCESGDDVLGMLEGPLVLLFFSTTPDFSVVVMPPLTGDGWDFEV